MKRKPSHEQFSQQMAFKQHVKKSHSPINLKKKPKFENEVLSFLGPQKSKFIKPKQDNKKHQQKGDSNNSTTNCTISRSRIPKVKNKRQKEDKTKKHEGLSQNHIMDIINNFATKIQRQWRVYLMRKKFKELISSLKKHNKIYEENHHHIPSVTSFQKLKFDENKIKHLSYLTDNGQQIVSTYNLQKYQPYPSNPQENQRKDPLSYRSLPSSSNNSIRLKRQSFQTQQKQIIQPQNRQKGTYEDKNKEKLSSISKIPSLNSKTQHIIQKEDRRTSYDFQPSKKSNLQNRRHSTGDLLFQTRQVKSFQIDKAFQIKISQEYPKVNSIKTVKKIQVKSPLKRVEDQKEAFNIKYPFDKQLNYKRKEIQEFKKRKLLSIQNRFKRKEVTERSYLQILRRINEQHQNKIEYFKQRQGQIRSNWFKLVTINKQNRLQTKYLQDDNQNFHNSISNIDASVSFDKWDFNSSAKKSIDNLQLEIHHSKNYSLESVLRYLEDQDTEKELEERKFRKNKSKQVIEAIAERSKEISDKSFEQYVAQSKQIKRQENFVKEVQQPKDMNIGNKQVKDNIENVSYRNIIIQQQKEYKIQQKHEQIPNNSLQLQIQKINIIQTISHKKAQVKSQSQSLLISQIQAASPSDYLFSDKQIVQSQQKTILKDLLFKDFSSQEKGADKDKPKTSSLIDKFINIVNEKLLISNMKLINSIKFICAKLHSQMTKKKIKPSIKYPQIQCDISAVNTWLLQISHFILDNYQSVIKDNLTTIKQPPKEQLLSLAHKNIPYVNIYQTIPQYVFKDFQFHYIKTIAINNRVAAQSYDIFSTLLYTFHRSLVDSLNLSLIDELITGRRWLEVPWFNQFKQKKRILNDHAKISLQKSINVVSNWGEYGLGKLQFDDQIARLENREYEEQKINLVCRQQAINLQLNQAITQANMLIIIANFIFQEEIIAALTNIL